MAIQTEPTRISIPFADSGTKNTIPATNSTPSASQAASWTDGFPAQCSLPLSAGGIPPARADFNGILNTMTQSERFTQEGGVWTWASTVDYGTNRMVLGSNGKIYWSVAQSGPNVGGAKNPVSDNGTYWTEVPTDNGDVMHLSGTETATGIKTFQGHLNIRGTDTYIRLQRTDGSFADTSTTPGGFYNIVDKNGTEISRLGGELSGSSSLIYLRTAYREDAGKYLVANLVHTGTTDQFIAFRLAAGQTTGGVVDLGSSSFRWKQLYATTATIDTSDARMKTEPEPMPDAVLDAWGEVGFMQFQMLDAVEKKGSDAARLHSGLIAQQIEETFKRHGLDASRYGLFCYDSWEAEPGSKDADGNLCSPSCPAGDVYSLRYEEALCVEAAYQRRRADRAEARIKALEDRLEALEVKLS